jgi:hypothetical protein
MLALPHGVRSQWLHGALAGGGGGLVLLLAAKAERCPCLSPRDGSCDIMDGVLLDLGAVPPREARLAPSARTGGALARLSPAAPLLADGGGGGGDDCATVSFEALRAHGDGEASAARALAEHFPALAAALVARGGAAVRDAVVVVGEATIAGALRWQPLDAADSACAALLRRRWHDDGGGDACEIGGGGGGAAVPAAVPPVPAPEADADGWITSPRLAARLKTPA